jgi:hypothetical protein
MDLNRRRFLGGTAALALISPAAAKDEEAYRLLTADAEIEMTIEFHAGYASRGFWFGEQMSNRNFCLSARGEEGSNCIAGFRGSLAIARYRVRPRSHAPAEPVLREHVRTIDHDIRLPDRPPFDRSIVLKKGVGSDLQAFGYEAAPADEPLSVRHGPWYLTARTCSWSRSALHFLPCTGNTPWPRFVCSTSFQETRHGWTRNERVARGAPFLAPPSSRRR